MASAKRVVAVPGEDAAAEAFAATMSLLDGLAGFQQRDRELRPWVYELDHA